MSMSDAPMGDAEANDDAAAAGAAAAPDAAMADGAAAANGATVSPDAAMADGAVTAADLVPRRGHKRKPSGAPADGPVRPKTQVKLESESGAAATASDEKASSAVGATLQRASDVKFDDASSPPSVSIHAMANGAASLQVQPRPRPLRIMLWNLQDLGGGPSRGPDRGEEVLERIARVIDAYADVAIILEVKHAYRPPRPPEPTVARTFLARAAKKASAQQQAAVVEAEVKEQRDRYEKNLAEYEARVDLLCALGKKAPGLAQLARVLAYLNLADDTWAMQASEATEGEGYAFLFRGGLGLRVDEVALIAVPALTERGFRLPCRARLRAQGCDLTLVAFHAPSPAHGQATVEAVNAVSQAVSEVVADDLLFASDTNLNTAAARRGERDVALDALAAFAVAGDVPVERTGRVVLRCTFTGQLWLQDASGRQELQADQATLSLAGPLTWALVEDDQKAYLDALLEGGAFCLDDQVLTLSAGQTLLVYGRARAVQARALDPTTAPAAQLGPSSSLDEKVDAQPAESSLASGPLLGRTSLKVKVATSPSWRDTETFNHAGYDKLEHRASHSPRFEHVQTFAVPLVEHCLRESKEHKDLLACFDSANLVSTRLGRTKDLFKSVLAPLQAPAAPAAHAAAAAVAAAAPMSDVSAASASPSSVASAAAGPATAANAQARMQAALREIRMLSDHVPVVMILQPRTP